MPGPSYLSSKMHAAQLWTHRFAPRATRADPDSERTLSRESGERLRHEVLALGGATQPGSILQNFLDGEAPSTGPMLAELKLLLKKASF